MFVELFLLLKSAFCFILLRGKSGELCCGSCSSKFKFLVKSAYLDNGERPQFFLGWPLLSYLAKRGPFSSLIVSGIGKLKNLDVGLELFLALSSIVFKYFLFLSSFSFLIEFPMGLGEPSELNKSYFKMRARSRKQLLNFGLPSSTVRS